MILSYIKIAFRNLARYRAYSLINIVGLGLGMACAILISLWVIEQFSFDRFHLQGDRIYRVNTRMNDDAVNTNSSWRLGPALLEKYPEIVDFARVRFRYNSLVKYQDRHFDETRIYLTDPAFFSMFTFPFIKGSPETALQELNSIVLTESAAQRYFGDEDPLGKTLYLAREQADFVVTGVVQDITRRSHIDFDMVARIELMGQQRLESWEFTGPTYVLLAPGVSYSAFNHKITDFYREVVDPEVEAYPVLQPLHDIHLYQFGVPGLIRQVYIFSIISVLILGIACINFINLSTAGSTRRAVEVGVRKVVGANRHHLVRQFLSESILSACIALGFALVLVELTLPAFNSVTGEKLSLNLRSLDASIIGILLMAPAVGILAGYIPALMLASFQPAGALKKQVAGFKGATIRKVLVLVQFAISIGLITCIGLVSRQLNLIGEMPLGYDRENLIAVPNNPELMKNFDSFKTELLADDRIENVTAAAMSSAEIGEVIEIDWEGNPDDNSLAIGYTMVDYDFFETFGMEMVQGRSFSPEFQSDLAEACIINETALAAMNIDDPLGKTVYFNHPALDEDYKTVRIIGVVKDFHFRSLFQGIGPFIFRMHKPWYFGIFIRLQESGLQAALNHIETTFQHFSPEYPFRYQFVDEAYWQLYASEVRMKQLFYAFGILAVLISCMGLLGLTLFNIERKTKEIGIRKTLGATNLNLVMLLSKDLLRLVLLSNLIAWPVTWYVMQRWLQNFAYRIDIGWSIFLFAGALALIIALATMSLQTLRAALANPVKSLRYE